jgi:hypothetical protein
MTTAAITYHNGMRPLFEKARAEKLWFFTPYQQLWFTPDELLAYNEKGRFLWSAENWKLRSKSEYLEQFEQEAKKAHDALLAAKEKVRRSND